VIRLVSISGGKDSTATLLVALERHPKDEIFAAFADTGNEHELTYEAVRYLERATGIRVEWLKQDFTHEWSRKRDYVRDKWAGKGVPDHVIDRALAVLDPGPTGVPFLDLCVVKSRFPSSLSQFCTQHLKTEPLTDYAMELIEDHGEVESWQGVRADESLNRAGLSEREVVGGGLTIYRPILTWSVDDVFAIHRKHGIEPNPLYSMGMDRVGCFPCINTNKLSLREMATRFPLHIDRIEEWERIVGETSRRQFSTFFPSPGGDRSPAEVHAEGNIRQVVEWSRTSRGGKQYDLMTELVDLPACSSSYGLCE